jgi:hypothetical protein
MSSSTKRLIAAAWVAVVIGFVPQTALAHGQSLADGLLVVFVLFGIASLGVLALFVAGVVSLVRLRSGVQARGRPDRARRLGLANVVVGGLALVGTVVAALRSADGWKLALVGLPLLALGMALLRAVRGSREPPSAAPGR